MHPSAAPTATRAPTSSGSIVGNYKFTFAQCSEKDVLEANVTKALIAKLSVSSSKLLTTSRCGSVIIDFILRDYPGDLASARQILEGNMLTLFGVTLLITYGVPTVQSSFVYSEENNDKLDSKGGFPWWAGLLLAAFVVGMAVAVYMVKRRKKEAKDSTKKSVMMDTLFTMNGAADVFSMNGGAHNSVNTLRNFQTYQPPPGLQSRNLSALSIAAPAVKTPLNVEIHHEDCKGETKTRRILKF